MDYKKYSLENLENWMHDCMSSGEATPQEIYDTIHRVVEENYYHHKHHSSEAYELLALLNGNGKGHVKAYDDFVNKQSKLSCDKDDPSPECKSAWNDFWEVQKETKTYDQMIAEGYEMTDDGFWVPKPEKDSSPLPPQQKYIGWTDVSEKKFDEMFSKKDEITGWRLPIEVDELTGECFINFPDDLLEKSNLLEGDQVEWTLNKDGSFTIRKVTKLLGIVDC